MAQADSPVILQPQSSMPVNDILCNCDNQKISSEIHHHHHYHYDSSAAPVPPVPPHDSSTITTAADPLSCNTSYFEKIVNQLNVTLAQLQSLHDKTEPLNAKINSLEEVLRELLEDTEIGTKLLLTGNPPPEKNLFEAVRGVITEKLDLHDLSENIVSAEQNSDGIVFEMATSVDKKRILFRARDLLKSSSLHIVDFDAIANKHVGSSVLDSAKKKARQLMFPSIGVRLNPSAVTSLLSVSLEKNT